MSRQTKWYGWKPDIPDSRDFYYNAPKAACGVVPTKQFNTQWMSEVFNQGSIGSCVGNAWSAAFKFNLQKQNANNIFTPSRLFIYYNARLEEGTENIDNGAQIRDGLKAVSKYGVCDESSWGYDTDCFANKPSRKCYLEAMKHQAIEYRRVPQTLQYLKSCIAEGFVFVFGFTVYESFESSEMTKTGMLRMPKPGESMIGGHAVCCFGYDDDFNFFPTGQKGAFIIRNSWGVDWGEYGNFYMPYDYIINDDLAADFWTVKLVET